jgi:hypothetical protein
MNTSMVIRRLQRRVPAGLAAIVFAAGAVCAEAPTAVAADPIRNCPPPYTLTDAAFGPQTMALDLAGNHDGWICRLPFRAGELFGIANIIDNHIPLDVNPGP